MRLVLGQNVEHKSGKGESKHINNWGTNSHREGERGAFFSQRNEEELRQKY